MSLIVLLTAVAQAQDSGSVIWLGVEADPTLYPRLQTVDADTLVPDYGITEQDVAALERLSAELEAVRPLADEFDGELTIMARLEASLADVGALRDDADRDLVYRALLFQGFAVHRYFQDQLGEDPAAAPYRTTLNGQVVVEPWVHAAALMPAGDVSAQDIPEDTEALAYDATRAQVRLAPPATVAVLAMPGDALLLVDGVAAVGAQAKVAPGVHWYSVEREGTVLLRGRVQPEAGAEVQLALGAMREDLDALGQALSAQPEALAIDPEVAALLAEAPVQPVHVAVPGKKEPALYRIDGTTALRFEEAAPAGANSSEPAFALRASVSGGWLYDGGYYIHNAEAGAPAEKRSVNSALPVLHVGAEMTLGRLALGAGSDLLIPTGAWHTLPYGTEGAQLRVRAYPHLSAGIPQVKATLGWLFPWQLGIGARAHVPVGPVELSAAGLYGVGMPLDRDDATDFEAENAYGAWVGVGWRFGL